MRNSTRNSMRNRMRNGMRHTGLLAVLLAGMLGLPRVANADIAIGATGPSFTKTQLGGGNLSYASPSGHPTLLFLLGYGCPFCQSAAPSVQQDLADYYEQRSPGMLKVVGVDLWNGTASQLAAFKSQTGVQFPLLLNGAATSGGDVQTLYGTYDNYVVLDAQGVVRYHAALKWPHGNRYHLDELRAALDPLVPKTAGVGTGTERGALRLAIGSVPARGRATLRLDVPAGATHTRVTLLDITGRVVRTLRDDASGPGTIALEWDGRDASGVAVPAGVYLARAEAGAQAVTARLVWLR